MKSRWFILVIGIVCLSACDSGTKKTTQTTKEVPPPPSLDVPVADKEPSLPPLPAIVIDPANHPQSFRASPGSWGVHIDFAAPIPVNLTRLSPGSVYVSGNAENLFDTEGRKWNEDKVRALAKSLLTNEASSEITISVPLWPSWLDEDGDGFLDKTGMDEYADLAARFAEIVWEFPSHERVRFELLNECDDLYHADLVSKKLPHRVADLARIYLTTASRIRASAHRAKIGGPSVRDAGNLDFHEQFIAFTAPALDFFSVQFPKDGTINSVADSVKTLQEILDRNSRTRRIPLVLNAISSEQDDAHSVRAAIAAYAAAADSANLLSGKSDAHWAIANMFFGDAIAVLETEQPDDVSAIVTEDGKRVLIAYTGLEDRKITLPAGGWSAAVLGKDPENHKVNGEVDLPASSVLFLELK